ncbi:MAG: serine/threonine protein kinase [Eggerthellaceae bacterium]|nr:serine/threonine protein kinase [Eggerthellaceae bacterium]
MTANGGGLERGDVLKGKYEILTLIGKGGMSRVYLAQDLDLGNKQWAVKEVDRRVTDALGRPIEQSLSSEAELLSRLQHPAIVGIADILKTEDFIYVIMDHVEGQTLEEVVRANGPQSEPDVQRWMLQICDALSYLHRQDPPIIYRDMKPNNIILHPDGYVKLIDLGVAREYKDDQRKDTTAFGTTGYAAPEQYGRAQTDGRADIYGVGATMWHLLGGAAPPVEFPLPNVRQANPAVGEGFADVIIPKCAEVDRSKRYKSCDDLVADLATYEELTRDHRSRQVKRIAAFASLALAAVAFCVMAVACFAWRDVRIAQNHDHHMDVASALVQVSPEDAQQEYLAAIAQRPDSVDAYLGLIESYKVDSAFTPEEKAQLDAAYGQNLEALKGSDRFAELSYEMGRLYWYFYSYAQTGTYEDNQLARIKASAEHFKNAAADGSFPKLATAETYAGIAQFASGIDAAVMQGEESGELYAGFWESICALSEPAEAEALETVQLDGCALIANALETYVGKFQAMGGVGRDEMFGLLAKVRGQLESLDTTTEQNEALRAGLLARLEGEIPQKLDAVFSAADLRSV